MNHATAEKVYNVLFLCRGNSARSIMAEAILDREGVGHFRAFSAGNQPAGRLDPSTVNLLRKLNHSVEDLHSKSWEVFGQPGAAEMDFVFTVCDEAAAEICPVWPGHPITAHWGVPDPVTVTGTEAEKALATADVYRMLSNRIGIFVNLPLRSLNQLALLRRLREIGQQGVQAKAS